MPWGNTWTRQLKESIERHYSATFGRELVVDAVALEEFLQSKKLKTEQAAFAHFCRVMKHYKDKYAFVPRFSHLLSAKIPTVETTGWEARLYSDFPGFSPVAYVPAKSALNGDVEYSGLFDAHRSAYFFEFACRISEHPRPLYCYNAAYLVERLIFSLAKTRNQTRDRLPVARAVAAHGILMGLRKSSRDTNKTWRYVHFSKALVRHQVIQLFGQYFNFWELPKMLIDSEFASQILNCRLTPAHRQAIYDVLSTYGYTHRAYLPFIIRTRGNYILRLASEKSAWEKMKPDFVCEYPF